MVLTESRFEPFSGVSLRTVKISVRIRTLHTRVVRAGGIIKSSRWRCGDNIIILREFFIIIILIARRTNTILLDVIIVYL